MLRFQCHGDAGGRYPVRGHGSGLQLIDPVLFHHQLVSPQAMEQAGVVVQGTGDSSGQRPLLGVGGAAYATIAQVPAAFDVAGNHFPGPAKGLTALAQDVVIDVGFGYPGFDVVPLLAAIEPGPHGFRAQVVQPEPAGPMVEGRFRRAEARGPVHRGGASHTATLQNGNGTVTGNPAHTFLVKGGIGVQLIHFEIFLIIKPAFLNQNHRQPGPGQYLSRGATTGTGADDHHIRFVGLVL